MSETRQLAPAPIPTITVKGVGEVSVEPDRVALSFSVNHRAWEYADSINGLNSKVEELRVAIEAEGLRRKDLKTSSFDVSRSERWVSEDDEHVFNGYVASHRLRISMPLDQQRLNSVLGRIAESLADADFSISFETSKQAELSDQLLANAVADARHKAEQLTQAAGVELGQILHIGNTWSEIEFSSRRHQMDERMCYSAAPDIEPEEISSSDTVEVVWALA